MKIPENSEITFAAPVNLSGELASVKRSMKRMFRLYEGKNRASWGIPYFVHSLAVLWVLKSYSQPLDVCLAGFFHSVLNDLPHYTYRQLAEDTNDRTAQLVKEVTENNSPDSLADKKANWRARKEDILQRFPAMSLEAKLIFTAANSDNLSSLMDYYCRDEEKIWRRLNASKEDMAWYYQAFSRLLTTHFNHPISGDYHKFLVRAAATFKW